MVYYLMIFLFFGIPLLYYYINLRSSTTFCLSSGDIYLSLDFSLSCSLVTFPELFCNELLDPFMVLLVTLLSIK